MTTIKRITITNPTRRRGWGWNYSTTPTGQDAWSISEPSGPAITGTLKQVEQAIRTDRNYQSLRSGGTFVNARWYYRGQPIHDTRHLVEQLNTIEWEREWCKKNERKPQSPLTITIYVEENPNA